MFKKKIATEEKLEIYSLNVSSPEFIEAYNTLVINIIQQSNEKEIKTIAVTSSKYGEGKSTVAINLAKALASNLLGKKILLVDVDFRNPKIQEFLGYDGENADSALSDYLSDKNPKIKINDTEISNLRVIYAGNNIENPLALIKSDKMRDNLIAWKDEYDFIIIDTPPVINYSDALFITDQVDGFVISTKRKTSTISNVDLATDRIAGMGAKILGFVFSK